MAEQVATVTETRAKAGKYLTFGLGQEEYGLDILQVREIVGLMDITAVPKAPSFVRGIVNLRGKIVPVMDLRERFGLPATETDEATCIIVVQLGRLEVGLIVDRVLEVLDIPAGEIAEAPSFGKGVDNRFVEGIGKASGRVVILLDAEKVLTADEAGSVSDMQG
jgi:purine-binding chemotaxis protein CheW